MSLSDYPTPWKVAGEFEAQVRDANGKLLLITSYSVPSLAIGKELAAWIVAKRNEETK